MESLKRLSFPYLKVFKSRPINHLKHMLSCILNESKKKEKLALTAQKRCVGLKLSHVCNNAFSFLIASYSLLF